MEKRFKKEYKINLNDEFKIKMGTVNRFNPKVVYVNCRTWLTPSEHNTTNQVHEILYNLQKKMKKIVYCNDYLENETICQVDFTSLPLVPNKCNLLEIEFYVSFKDYHKELKEIKINPKNENIEELMIKLAVMPNERILLSVDYSEEILLPEDLKQLILDFDKSTIYGVPFDVVANENTDYDMIIRITIDAKFFSPEYSEIVTHEEKKDNLVAKVSHHNVSKSAIFLGMDKNFHLNFKYVFLLPKFKFHKNVLMHVHTSNVKCIFYYDKYIQLNIPSLHTISLNVDI